MARRVLPPGLFDRVIARLQQEEARLQGVLVGGSFARGGRTFATGDVRQALVDGTLVAYALG